MSEHKQDAELRAKFEAWAEKNDVDMLNQADGTYFFSSTTLMWEAFRAASSMVSKTPKAVGLDIAKWFINGDRPDEWKLKEWAELLDGDALTKAYFARAALDGEPK